MILLPTIVYQFWGSSCQTLVFAHLTKKLIIAKFETILEKIAVIIM